MAEKFLRNSRMSLQTSHGSLSLSLSFPTTNCEAVNIFAKVKVYGDERELYRARVFNISTIHFTNELCLSM
jgi:hypothetical protein